MLHTSIQPSLAQKKTRPDPLLMVPNDHGAYAMLFVPLLAGLFIGAIHSSHVTPALILAGILLALALAACFCVLEPLRYLVQPGTATSMRRPAQRWLAVYLVLAAASGLPLLIVWQHWDLVVIGFFAIIPKLASLVALRIRRPRNFLVRLFSIDGLALSAPAAFSVMTGRLDLLAFCLWIICWTYFAGTLFFVRLWFETKKHTSHLRRSLPSWLRISTWLYWSQPSHKHP